jgi:hypothetical protein
MRRGCSDTPPLPSATIAPAIKVAPAAVDRTVTAVSVSQESVRPGFLDACPWSRPGERIDMMRCIAWLVVVTAGCGRFGFSAVGTSSLMRPTYGRAPATSMVRRFAATASGSGARGEHREKPAESRG